MALKKIRVLYTAKNFATGLSNVKAQIYVNQVAKAVGASALALTELDATNAPGLYYVELSPATLAGYGAVAGDAFEAEINSTAAGNNAPAVYKEIISAISTDDIDAKLGSPAGASVSADIAALKSELDTVNTATAASKADLEDATNGLPAIKTAVVGVQTTASAIQTAANAIKSDVEDGTNGLAAIKTAITALGSQVSSIQNNTNFEAFIPGLVKPTSGSTAYLVPITVQNEHGSVQDPDSNSVVVTLTNSAGADRSSLLTGNSGGSAAATRDAAGLYHVTANIASSTTEEELIFGFAYSVSSAPFAKRRTATVMNNVQADGFATQTTLLAVQTTASDTNTRVTDIQSKVNDSTIGLANIEALVFAAKADIESGSTGLAVIQGLLANGTYGVSAIQQLLASPTVGLAVIQGLLANGSFGLQALQTQGAAIKTQTDKLGDATYGLSAANTLQVATKAVVDGNTTLLGAIEGSGFVSATDSLAAISARVYTGGRAI